jgi:hypothetical protein
VDESTAVIRNQMDRTRADLSDQIDRLEHRVSENLFSTGEAVTDILGTVRETVRSVRHAADLRSHVVGHPWIAFGSAVALGYVATRLATRPKVMEAAGRQTAVPEVSRPATFVTTNGEQRRPLESQPQAPVRGGVRDILAGVLRDVAARGTPLVMDYLAAAIQAAAPAVWAGAAPPTSPDSTPYGSTSPVATVQAGPEASRSASRPSGPFRGAPRRG